MKSSNSCKALENAPGPFVPFSLNTCASESVRGLRREELGGSGRDHDVEEGEEVPGEEYGPNSMSGGTSGRSPGS